MESLLLNGICVNLIGIYCFWSHVQLRNEILLISSIHYVTKLIGQIQSVLSGDRWDSREGKKWVQGTVTYHQQPRPLTCGVPSECLRHEKLGNYVTWPAWENWKKKFCSTGACTVAKSPIANHHRQIIAQLYSASPIRHFWQQCHSVRFWVWRPMIKCLLQI